MGSVEPRWATLISRILREKLANMFALMKGSTVRNLLLMSLATLVSQIFFPYPAIAQEPVIDDARRLDAIHLQHTTLRMKVPEDFCRVDPESERRWYELTSSSLTGKLVGMWTLCEDLERMRGGEAIEPRRWIMAILQRAPDGGEGPMVNITRAYALGRWAEAFHKMDTPGSQAAVSIERAKQKIRQFVAHDLRIGQKQIIGPDGLAIYVAWVASLTDTATRVETPTATVGGWSLIEGYRIGIASYVNNGQTSDLNPLLEQVRDIIRSLDKYSKTPD